MGILAMNCASCGSDYPPDTKFCGRCGLSLAADRACSGCGTMNPGSMKFCLECGQLLTGPAIASATPLDMPTRATPLPTSFGGGRYLVRRFLGEGAKKRVYLAQDTKLDRNVAFALIKTEGLDADGLVRIRREAQAMGRLGDHAHIVTVFDAGDEDGAPYMVTQLMGGGSIEGLLGESEHRRLPAERAMTIAEQVCAGLEHAHRRGIIHRDLKPGNVWLSDDGTAALGDFGLAIAIDRSRMTMVGMMVGTVAYMAPEQAVGRAPDARSDLYSMGAMLYEMVTGRPPFLGDDALGVISQHINTAPVAPTWHNPEIPRPLETLILRLLAKSPEERYTCAADVAAELRRILDRSTASITIEPRPADSGGDLRGLDWGRFVGRREEMDLLKESLESSLSGKTSLAFLAGEPGIGKTRLADEFKVYASLRGAYVLAGHCYEGESSIPYRPFVEAFRQYARARPDADLHSDMAAGAPEIAMLVPEIGQRFPDIRPAPQLDAEAERLRLFDSVAQFLRNASLAQPILLHIDDLHWADEPSLRLLQHIARVTTSDRILILGAYRDIELDRKHPLAETLAALRRLPNFRRIALHGLSNEAIADLLETIDASDETAAGRAALSAALQSETEGNPFFLREVLSHLVEEGKLYRQEGRWLSRATSISELGIPEGVREVIGRRLSRLSDACSGMLTRAATMTRGFTWEALQAITQTAEVELLDLLDEALAAQLIAQRPNEIQTTYDFTHALIRQTLYQELSAPRRVLLHRQIAAALETLYASNLEPHVAELADHFYQAAPGGDVRKAVEYASRAGARAMSLYAYEEAARNMDRALQLSELGDVIDAHARCELLLTLADAQLKSGDIDVGNATVLSAAEMAKSIGAVESLARAALLYGGPGIHGAFRTAATGVADAILIDLLEAALALVGDQHDALEAQLLARLASSLEFADQYDRRQDLSARALALATRCGDQHALFAALEARHVALSMPGGLPERLDITTRMLELARATGDLEIAFAGYFWRIPDLLELGDADGADKAIDAREEICLKLRRPGYMWYTPMHRAMRANMGGRFGESEQLSLESLRLGQGVDDVNANIAFAINLGFMRTDQGRASEIIDGIIAFARENPANRAWRCGVAHGLAQGGRTDEARAELDEIVAGNVDTLPRDLFRYFGLAVLADVAATVGAIEPASALYELLAPQAGRCIVLSYGSATVGAADRLRGMLAGMMQMWDEAERHFEDAIDLNARMGARIWLARTHLSYAQMLCRRMRPGDREKAMALVQQALEAAQDIGMRKVVDDCLALKIEAQGIRSGDIYTSIDAVAASVRSEHTPLPAKVVAPDGTVTIMFSDIEDSTVLTERLGDQAWQELLRKHNTLIREQLRAHNGFEVKTMGDGFMIAFQSALKGLDCAIAIQHAFAELNAVDGEHVRVRIGLHAGEALRENEDFYGKNVIMASRVAGKATGGEILVSSLLRQLVESTTDASIFGEPHEVELKGLSGTHCIYAVEWQRTY